jgi:hypothetical protein
VFVLGEAVQQRLLVDYSVAPDSTWFLLMGNLGSHLDQFPHTVCKANDNEVPGTQEILSSCLLNVQCISLEIDNKPSSKKISQHDIFIWKMRIAS